MTANAQLSKAYVNNGGDIALYLSDGEEFSVGMVERPDRPSLFGTLRIDASNPVAESPPVAGADGASHSASPMR